MSTFGVNTVVVKSNKVLLVKRSDFNIWALPGGAVNNGESLETAAIRETKEESNIAINIIRLIGVFSIPKWLNGGDHSLIFLCNPISSKLKPDQKETIA